MSSNPATSINPGGPPIHIDGEKTSIGLAIVANILEMAAVLVQTSNQTKTFLFVLALLVGTGLMLWVTLKWPKSTIPNAVFAVGTLAAFALLFWGTANSAPAAVTVDPPTIYYVRVLAFANDAHDGEIETDHPLAGITIMTRDQYGHTATYQTGMNGTQAIPIESLPPNTFAVVTIGACGIFQTHHISRESRSSTAAQVVQIGIDPQRVDICRG